MGLPGPVEGEKVDPANECANCGATSGLMRCSRCKMAWYCSVQCHKAYWPVHKSSCRANDFATAIEASEPRFAAWMRQHGKQAVIKDEEVERLERASRAVCAQPSRQEMMESMYGRADPKPLAPTYSPDEWLAMSQRQQTEAAQAALLSPQDRAWLGLPPIQPGLGLDCGWFRWQQNLSHVDVAIKLPGHVSPDQVVVHLGRNHLAVHFPGQTVMDGALYREVELSGSTWFIDTDTGILHLELLKRSRKGRYQAALPGTRPLTQSRAQASSPRLLMAAIEHPEHQHQQHESTLAAGCEEVPEACAQPGAGTQQALQVAKPRIATAADTWWRSLLLGAPASERMVCDHPPAVYYMADYSVEEC